MGTHEDKKPSIMVVDEIKARMAAIAPEQLENSVPRAPLGKGVHRVGTATDGMKRLFVLHHLLAVEGNELIEEAKKLTDAESPSAADKARLAQLKTELSQRTPMVEIAQSLFFLEMRRQFPEIADKQIIGVRKGWAVCWREPEDDDGPEFHIIGFGDSSGLSGVLAALARRKTRTH